MYRTYADKPRNQVFSSMFIVYILLSSLNVVQIYAAVSNNFTHIALVVICTMQIYQHTLRYIEPKERGVRIS